MHIFATGATGFVGTAVVQELIAAAHKVTGLARSDAGASALKAMGAEVRRGAMEDLDILKSCAAASDGVMHLAFNHDFSKFAENCEADRRAITALASALEASDRPLLVTSGLALLATGRTATEDDNPSPAFPRGSEAAANAAAERGVRASAVRLPPSTHGAGDHGFVPHLINLARDKGVSAYIGDGQNRWAATHRADAAKVYRLAIESGVTGGPYHAVDEGSIPFKEIAETIGNGLNVPVVSVSPQGAEKHFGWFTRFAGMDVPTSSERTRSRLGWKPTEAGLIADMKQHYFG